MAVVGGSCQWLLSVVVVDGCFCSLLLLVVFFFFKCEECKKMIQQIIDVIFHI